MEVDGAGKQAQRPKHFVVKKIGGEKNGKTRVKRMKKSVSHWISRVLHIVVLRVRIVGL